MSADFWAGYVSGAIAIVIGNPLDLIKVRLQASSSPSSAAGTPTVRLPLTHHFTSAATLVTGTAAPILGYGSLNALLFMSYNRSERWFTELLHPTPSPAAIHSRLVAGNGPPPFRPGENLAATWLAGAVGGLATWVVSTPTELIKCRAQMAAPAGSPAPSSWGTAKQVVRSEGIRGLYFGGLVTATRDSVGYGFYFWTYELLNRWVRPQPTGSEDGNLGAGSDVVKVLLCGGVAGIATWASIFPLDVVKTRVQTQPLFADGNHPAARRKGAWEVARQTYRQEGVRPFFRGLGVCSARAFVVNAVQWAVYEWIMKELGQGRDRTGKSVVSVKS